MKIKAKKEQRVAKETEFEALVKKAETQELTADEQKKLDDIETELQELDAEIKKMESIEARKKQIALRQAAAVGAPQDNASEIREMKKFEFTRAMGQIHNESKGIRNGTVSGLEKEIFDEATAEYKAAGVESELCGNIRIPSRMIQLGKQQAQERLLNVATEGSDVVETEYGGLIGSLRIEPVVDRLGATKLTGLRGNLKWPRSNNDLELVWETETSDSDELTPTFDAVDLSPKRASGFVDVSIQMMKQSPFVMESFVRGKLQYAGEATIDKAALAGPTGGNSPVGILNYSGVTVVSLGTNGGDMTYGALLAMISEAQQDNARDGNSGFVMNPAGFYALGRTPMQASGVEGNFILKPATEKTIFGHKYIVTNRMPANLTKGSGSALSAIIYSPRWASLIIGMWGGMDILYDPYTQAQKATVRFHVNMFADVDVEHPEEYVVVKDWITTTPATT